MILIMDDVPYGVRIFWRPLRVGSPLGLVKFLEDHAKPDQQQRWLYFASTCHPSLCGVRRAP